MENLDSLQEFVSNLMRVSHDFKIKPLEDTKVLCVMCIMCTHNTYSHTIYTFFYYFFRNVPVWVMIKTSERET